MPKLSKRATLLLGLAVFVVGLGVAAARVSVRESRAGVELGAPWAFGDFRNTVYYPERFFLAGGNPYDVDAYHAAYPNGELFPPYLPETLLIHFLPGVLPLGVAQACYAGVIVLLTGVLVWIGFRPGGADVGRVTGATGLTLLSRAGQWNLLLGQVTLQAALPAHAALRLARRAPMVAGLALGIAAFKPTFGLPLAVLMLARGDWRVLLAATGFGTLLNAPVVTMLAVRAGGLRPLVENIVHSQRRWTGNGLTGHRLQEGLGFNPTSIHRIDVLAISSRLLPPELTGAGVDLVVTLLLVGFAAFVVRRVATRAPDRVAELADPVIAGTILLCIYHLDYDLLLLVPFVIAAVRGAVAEPLRRGAPRWVLLAGFAGLAMNYASTQGVAERFGQQPVIWTTLMAINPLLLLGVTCVYAVAAIRVTRVVEPSLAPLGVAVARS